MKSLLKIYIVFPVFALLIAVSLCNSVQENNIERAFYYWKTTYDFDEKDIAYADTIGLQRMYIKCFDVEWSANLSKPVPVGMINTGRFMQTPFESVTPCVFITNTVIEKCNDDELQKLAEKISKKVSDIISNFAISYANTKTQKMRDSANALDYKYPQKLRDEIYNRIEWSEKTIEND